MNSWRSIKVALSAVFGLFLTLIAILGIFAVSELRAVNQVSGEIRERWLQSTRVLGDLNNYSSDARAAEASRLLAQDSGQTASVDRQIEELSRQVDQSERSWRRIAHDGEEAQLYDRFAQAWSAYERVAGQVLALSRQGRSREAAALYMTGSLRAYAAASDALGVLTDRTVVRARQASFKAETTYRTARALILALLILAALSLVLAINYITRFISGPLLGLAARMRSLADNDTQIEIEGAQRRDEIGEMARAVVVFRNNAIDLALSQRGLERQAAMLEERLQAEQSLTSLQRNFVAMASHEFRTPLTIIDAHAQRLTALRDQLPPGDIAERAGRIRNAVRRMTHMIEGLLHSTRLFDGETGLYFHPTAIDPKALLVEVCHVHREIAAGANIVERLRDLPPSLTGDPALLHQAFSNLLANAVKFSPNGGQVELSATVEGERLVVRVSDHGIGIPLADREKVFERYHRGSNAKGIVGTGVGLFLVKMVVDLHGGELAVDSEEGVGSTFTVRLSLRPSVGLAGTNS